MKVIIFISIIDLNFTNNCQLFPFIQHPASHPTHIFPMKLVMKYEALVGISEALKVITISQTTDRSGINVFVC